MNEPQKVSQRSRETNSDMTQMRMPRTEEVGVWITHLAI